MDLAMTVESLGHNLMDHHFRVGASGYIDGFEDKYYLGRRPNGIYIPRFRNIDEKRTDYIRGFGYQGRASREDWRRGIKEMSFGVDFKEEMTQPGPWQMGIGGFGECLPYHENKVTLNKEVLDVFGMPTLTMDCEFKENEKAMRKDMLESAVEMLEASGLKDVKSFDRGWWSRFRYP